MKQKASNPKISKFRFTPLEKVHPVRRVFTNGIREPNSLTGFTLVEVIVSLLILAIAVTGLFASFVAAQRYVSRSRHRLVAANAARMAIESLKSSVDQRTWDDPAVNLLACAAYPCTKTYALPADYQGTPWNWSANYVVTPISVGGVDMRRVDVTVRWDESNP